MTAHPNPIDAVTSPDPASIYRDLARWGGCVWHDDLGSWVVTRPESVQAVLEHPHCLVRPPAVPVPPSLAGTSCGELFSRWIRMNDGPAHTEAKRAVTLALAGIDLGAVQAMATRWTSRLLPEGISRVLHGTPGYVVATLLGIPEPQLPEVAAATAALVRGVAVQASGADIEAASHAVDALTQVVGAALETGQGSLAGRLADSFRTAGLADRDLVVANAIGLLFQAHDATAGLIGNAIVALAKEPEAIDPDVPVGQIRRIVEQATHDDPGVQNTRRYADVDVEICGCPVRAADSLLVLLAAANAGSAQTWTFGHGRHACPGRDLAMAIATACVQTVAREGLIPVVLPDPLTYAALPNVRIPNLSTDGVRQ